MRKLSPSTLLLICGCLLASGCDSKTNINDAAAVAEPIIDTSLDPESTEGNLANADSESMTDTPQVIVNPAANMIDPATTITTPVTTTQDPETTITTPVTTTQDPATTITTPVTTTQDPATTITTPVTTTQDPATTITTTVTTTTQDPETTITTPVTTTTDDSTNVTPVSSDPLTPTTSDSLTPGTTPTPVVADTPSTVVAVIPETTTGVAGMTVDCEQSLPCQWVSADSGFSATVTNVDNNGRLNRLRVDYSIVTAHDTEITVIGANAAAETNGTSLGVTAISLGNGVGGVAQGLLAGTTLPSSVEFSNTSTASSIDTWSIALSDSGLARTPTFTNLPVGPLTNQIADCENTLPCVWVPPNAEVTITLLAVSGTGSSNLLTTNFSVVTTRTSTVAIDSGATAIGVDGASYRGRTHTVAQQTGAEKLTVDTIAGAQVVATVLFFRTQSISTALQNLSLIAYEDNPVPRWNPMFTNVPVQ